MNKDSLDKTSMRGRFSQISYDIKKQWNGLIKKRIMNYAKFWKGNNELWKKKMARNYELLTTNNSPF